MRINGIILFFSCLSLQFVSYGETNYLPSGTPLQNQKPVAPSSIVPFSVVLEKIEEGIKRNEGNALATYFAAQVYLNLQSEEEGYFSANQASLVLGHYLSVRKVLNFHFTTKQEEGGSAYATGGGTIIIRGVTEIIQLYVSFGLRSGKWVVTQFNIY
jgi:hypothetical protein